MKIVPDSVDVFLSDDGDLDFADNGDLYPAYEKNSRVSHQMINARIRCAPEDWGGIYAGGMDILSNEFPFQKVGAGLRNFHGMPMNVETISLIKRQLEHTILTGNIIESSQLKVIISRLTDSTINILITINRRFSTKRGANVLVYSANYNTASDDLSIARFDAKEILESVITKT